MKIEIVDNGRILAFAGYLFLCTTVRYIYYHRSGKIISLHHELPIQLYLVFKFYSPLRNLFFSHVNKNMYLNKRL